jgi:hypothetical protein
MQVHQVNMKVKEQVFFSDILATLGTLDFTILSNRPKLPNRDQAKVRALHQG